MFLANELCVQVSSWESSVRRQLPCAAAPPRPVPFWSSCHWCSRLGQDWAEGGRSPGAVISRGACVRLGLPDLLFCKGDKA